MIENQVEIVGRTSEVLIASETEISAQHCRIRNGFSILKDRREKKILSLNYDEVRKDIPFLAISDLN